MVARGDLRAIRLMGKVVIPVVELERLVGIERRKRVVEGLSSEQLLEELARRVGPDANG